MVVREITKVTITEEREAKTIGGTPMMSGAKGELMMELGGKTSGTTMVSGYGKTNMGGYGCRRPVLLGRHHE